MANLTKQQLLAKILEEMKSLQGSDDPEAAHGTADELLCQALTILGQRELAEAFDKVDKWYA